MNLILDCLTRAAPRRRGFMALALATGKAAKASGSRRRVPSTLSASKISDKGQRLPMAMRYQAKTPKPCRLMKRTKAPTTSSARNKRRDETERDRPLPCQSSDDQFL